MLCSLKIENVAVIEKAEVEFGPGLNVLTGETGAGKSILIDSIHAILGDRTSRDIVRSHTPKACIWATFRDLPASVHRQLEQAGMDAGDELLLYREITAEGQSRFGSTACRRRPWCGPSAGTSSTSTASTTARASPTLPGIWVCWTSTPMPSPSTRPIMPSTGSWCR